MYSICFKERSITGILGRAYIYSESMHVTTTEEDKENYGINVLRLDGVGKGVLKTVVSNVTWK